MVHLQEERLPLVWQLHINLQNRTTILSVQLDVDTLLLHGNVFLHNLKNVSLHGRQEVAPVSAAAFMSYDNPQSLLGNGRAALRFARPE